MQFEDDDESLMYAVCVKWQHSASACNNTMDAVNGQSNECACTRIAWAVQCTQST